MTPERWRQVERVCEEALALAPADRAGFLASACAGDADLLAHVQSLLDEQPHSDTLLQTPAWDVAAEAFQDEDDAGRGTGKLQPGSRLGPFEVQTLIGAGGMGEVYRARDTRLGRTVALKVLPPDAAADPGRRSRLEAEARAVSALNHPHICSLFDIRSDEGVDYLVMEHLEGVTLEDRMRQPGRGNAGGVTFGDALEYGAQIADALAAAHREGIVHRDLKPGNIMLTRDGVKLLDFGLAKVTRFFAAPALAGAAAAPRTAAGVVLGTVNYMAPEQLQGGEADPRSDLFAFGALLYEMLTGRRAFEGASPASVIAAILDTDPPPASQWQPVAPPALDRLVRGCLAKDPAQRWDSALLAGNELRRLAAEARERDPRALLRTARQGKPRRARFAGRWRRPLLVAAAALAVLVALARWSAGPRADAAPGRMRRLDLDVGAGFVPHPRAALAALSPDGSRIAFTGSTAEGRDLFVRPLDRADATALHVGTVSDLFFSPDGQWVGFFRDGRIQKVSVAGGPAVDVCDAPSPDARGASWGDDGFIVAALALGEGLSRVPAGGGTPSPLTTLDTSRRELTHRWPQVLPGSGVVVFTSHTFLGRYDEATIEAVDVKTGRRTTLHRGGYFGRYLPSGHLVFVRHNALFAAPMDLGRLAIVGPAVPVLDAILADDETARAPFTFAASGEALALTGRWQPQLTVPAWRERGGRVTRLRVPPGDYADPRISPDGRHVMFTERQGGTRRILVVELGSDTALRMVSSSLDMSPLWAPDGRHIAFTSDEDRGFYNIYWRRADGAGPVQRLTRSVNTEVASSFTSDGRRLVFIEFDPVKGVQTRSLSLDLRDPDRPVASVPTFVPEVPDGASCPVLSPDGQWFAYTARQDGRSAVYVSRAGVGRDRWQVAEEGYGNPMWTPDGRSILFLAEGYRVMAVDVAFRAGAIVPGTPRPWAAWALAPWETRHTVRNFDVPADGRRLLILDPAEPAGTAEPRAALTLLENLFDELRRVAPPSR